MYGAFYFSIYKVYKMRIAVIGLRPRDHQHVVSKLPKGLDITFCEATDERQKVKSIVKSSVEVIYHNYRFGSHSTGWVLNACKNVRNYTGGISTLVNLIKSDIQEGLLS